jgi:hypothetical protein
MAFTQGAPLPDIKQTTTTQDNAPSYYTNYLSGLSQAGQTAMGKTPQQSVAGYDPLQTMGYSNLPAATTSYSHSCKPHRAPPLRPHRALLLSAFKP